MDANQLTTKSQEAYAAASRRALREGNPAVEPEHLLWAVLQDDQGIALQVLDAVGADREAVREDADKAVTGLPRASIGLSMLDASIAPSPVAPATSRTPCAARP